MLRYGWLVQAAAIRRTDDAISDVRPPFHRSFRPAAEQKMQMKKSLNFMHPNA